MVGGGEVGVPRRCVSGIKVSFDCVRALGAEGREPNGNATGASSEMERFVGEPYRMLFKSPLMHD